jgi:hypothetical protein
MPDQPGRPAGSDGTAVHYHHYPMQAGHAGMMSG